jgi:hypothetical protein
MFHLFNKVYLQRDFRFEHTYSFMVASKRWSTHPMIISKAETKFQANSFETLLQENFNNDIEQFWLYLQNVKTKFIVYVDPDIFLKLQIQYWKSIFKDNITINEIYTLYSSFVESDRLLTYYDLTRKKENADFLKPKLLDALKDIDKKTLEEITEIFNSTEKSDTLSLLSSENISIEYLLADYFYNNNTSKKSALLNKLKIITWDNIIDEFQHLRFELLFGGIDLNKIDPDLNVGIGNIEEKLKTSNILKWTVDPLFNTNIDYIKSNYTKDFFLIPHYKLQILWNKGNMRDLQGNPIDEGTGIVEDYTDLLTLIWNDQYETLLQRDIERGYGCIFSFRRMMHKSNHIFTSYLYDKVRNNNTNDLENFILRN